LILKMKRYNNVQERLLLHVLSIARELIGEKCINEIDMIG